MVGGTQQRSPQGCLQQQPSDIHWLGYKQPCRWQWYQEQGEPSSQYARRATIDKSIIIKIEITTTEELAIVKVRRRGQRSENGGGEVRQRSPYVLSGARACARALWVCGVIWITAREIAGDHTASRWALVCFVCAREEWEPRFALRIDEQV